MKLGLYGAILHDRSRPDAIAVVAEVGLTGLELSTGGLLPAVHVPAVDDIWSATPPATTSSASSRGRACPSPASTPTGTRCTRTGPSARSNEWPTDSAWDFVALGQGHDIAYWTEFLRALHEVDPDMLVNIEHEDTELGRVEGVTAAAEVLKAADARLEESLEWPESPAS